MPASDAGVPSLGACSNIGVYLLPDLLRKFQEASGTAPELFIGANPEVAERLARGEIDAALLEWWTERPGFRWRNWRSEPLAVIVAPGHPWSRRPGVTLKELLETPLIGGEPGTGTGRLLRRHAAAGSLPAPAMQLGSAEAVKRAVAAGLGISLVLACTVATEVREGRLCAVPLDEEPLEKVLRLVWREDLAEDEPLLRYLAAPASAA